MVATKSAFVWPRYRKRYLEGACHYYLIRSRCSGPNCSLLQPADRQCRHRHPSKGTVRSCSSSGSRPCGCLRRHRLGTLWRRLGPRGGRCLGLGCGRCRHRRHVRARLERQRHRARHRGLDERAFYVACTCIWGDGQTSWQGRLKGSAAYGAAGQDVTPPHPEMSSVRSMLDGRVWNILWSV